MTDRVELRDIETEEESPGGAGRTVRRNVMRPPRRSFQWSPAQKIFAASSIVTALAAIGIFIVILLDHESPPPGPMPSPSPSPSPGPSPSPSPSPYPTWSPSPTPAPSYNDDFNNVVRNYKKSEGYMNLFLKDTFWGKDLLMEVPINTLNKPFITSSMASEGNARFILYHMPITDGEVFQFEHKEGAPQLDLVYPDLTLRAEPGSEEEELLRKGDFVGWIDSFPIIVSRYDENGTAVSHLIDITYWILRGMSQLSIPGSSRLDKVHAFPENLGFEVICSSYFGAFGIYWALAKLPETPMVSRENDDRVGYFTETYELLGPDGQGQNPRDDVKHYDVRHSIINRWHLEKQDPSAALSDPVKPITYYLDPSVPAKWRPYLKEGVEAWSKAFEQVGFSNAVRAVLPTDADFPVDYNAGDLRYSSISWTPSLYSTYAVGPSTVDPRSGQILNADILFTEGWVKAALSDVYSDDITIVKQAEARMEQFATKLKDTIKSNRTLLLEPKVDDYFVQRAEDLVLARTVLERMGTRMNIDEYVGGMLKDVTMHEVGHTLGLRHNFKGSTARTTANLKDPAKQISCSVMDYLPVNVAIDPSEQGNFYMTDIGEYDMWAIRYGYTILEDEQRGMKHSMLDTIAAESENPNHAFGTDEDGPGSLSTDEDPFNNYFDLNSDPIVYFTGQFELMQSLMHGAVNRSVQMGESWTGLDKLLRTYTSRVVRAAIYLTKFVGGRNIRKLHRGEAGGFKPVEPVLKAQQQRAVAAVLDLFKSEQLLPPRELMAYLVSRSGWCYGLHTYCDGLKSDEPMYSYEYFARMFIEYAFAPLKFDRLNTNAWLHANENPNGGYTPNDLFSQVHQAFFVDVLNGGDLPPEGSHLRLLPRVWLRHNKAQSKNIWPGSTLAHAYYERSKVEIQAINATAGSEPKMYLDGLLGI